MHSSKYYLISFHFIYVVALNCNIACTELETPEEGSVEK